MSAYKKINKQDAYITTYTAHKTWAVVSGSFEDYGIEVFNATGSYSASLQQLYYPSKSQSNIVSHSFDYYSQTTLYFSQSRNFENNPKVISIPKNLYGVYIAPDKTLEVITTTSSYVTLGYWEEGYTEVSSEGGTRLVDDGEGNIIISGSSPTKYVGDVIYSHGIVVLTDPLYSSQDIGYVSFKSSQPVFTHNYHCKIRESEFNFTFNPSAISGSTGIAYDNEGQVYSVTSKISDGVLLPNVTGSDFQPYITTVGLYNDANELVAVGKLNRPVPKSNNVETTIIVKIDI